MPTADGPPTAGRDTVRTLADRATRSAWAFGVLALLYAAIALGGDARANSGSDAGGKAATVASMVGSGTWDVDIGYWAAEHDPEGRFHPLVKTRRVGDRWVQVTTLPMIYAARPLWSVGGPDLALALPMAGGLLAAWGARRLARSAGSTDGWAAFWLVGAGSPVVFYVADLWEHALGVGLVVATLSVLVDPERSTARSATLAGCAAGLAVSMRAETAVYLAVFSVVAGATGDVRRAWRAGRARAPLVAGAAVAVLCASWLLERLVVGAGLQSSRTSSQLDAAGATPVQRLEQAALTTVGLLPTTSHAALALGAMATGGLVLIGVALRRPDRRIALALGSTAITVGAVVRAIEGLGFIPGALPAAPLAGGAFGTGRNPVRRLLVATAIGALPLVWAVQWRGGLEAQWGGRVTLLTGVLLTVVGAVSAEHAGWRTPASMVLVATTVVVSAVGVAWHVERTRTVGDAFDDLAALTGDHVVVTTYDHLPREGGAATVGLRWLQCDEPELTEAVAVARAAGDGDVVLIESSRVDAYRPPTLPDLTAGTTSRVDWLDDVELMVTPYAPSP